MSTVATKIGKNDHQLPSRVEDSFAERPSNLESLDDDSELAALDTTQASRVVPLDASKPSTATDAVWSAICSGNCFRRKTGHKELQRFDATAAV